jgi:hypothetical protein
MTRPDFEFYGDEYDKVAIAMTRLSNAFDFSNFSDTNKAIFDIAANEEFAKIGITIAVNWQQIFRENENDGEEPTGVWVPGIEPVGHVGETETDHDRMRDGIVKGLDGGPGGYVREDGTVHAEPRKKDIL